MNYIPIRDDSPDYDFTVDYEFDEYCPAYMHCTEDNPMGNVQFVLGIQELAQAKLDASPTGVLYLVEVLKDLTIKPDKNDKWTRILGWNRYAGSGIVDFGLNPEDASCEADKIDRQLFLNGVEPSVMLSFNVDGPLVGQFRPMIQPF